MFLNTYSLKIIVCVSLFLGIIELAIYSSRRTKLKQAKLSGQAEKHEVTRSQLLLRKITNMTAYKKYRDWLETQIDLTFEEKETADGVIHFQQTIFCAGIAVSLILSFIHPLIGVGTLLVFSIIMTYPALSYKLKLSSKNNEFDKNLPKFINQIIMVLQVGVSVENAFGYGLQGMDDGLSKREFEKLVAEMSIHSDDSARVFGNLNKRVRTETCERFCSIIISGLKNGNKMSDILMNEYERIADNQITDLRAKVENKKTMITVLNFMFIFIPSILLLIIPMLNMGDMFN